MREGRETWLIGLSGGADSVALTERLLRQDACRLAAVHVHHGLRGAEADQDEAFVRDYCAARKLPLFCRHLVPPAHAGEDWARTERFRAFRTIAGETEAAGIYLAHHRRDQAETVLLHLLRGSGLDGLGGMRGESVLEGLRIRRPLLHESPEALRQELRSAGLAWREDHTNGEDDYLRNRVRHQLLPLMESLAPGAEQRLAQLAETLQADQQWLDRAAEEAAAAAAAENGVRADMLAAMPEALAIRILRSRWQEETGAGLPFAQTKRLYSLLTAPVGAKECLTGGMAQRGYDTVYMAAGDGDAAVEPVPVAADAGRSYTIGGISLSVLEGGRDPGDGKTVQEVPAGFLEGAVLRTRQRGDRIRPFGMSGSQKLQDWFVNRKVDAIWRDRIPLLCKGNEVYWAAGIGAGAVPRWNPGEKNVRLAWEGPMPWRRTEKSEDGHEKRRGNLSGPDENTGDTGRN